MSTPTNQDPGPSKKYTVRKHPDYFLSNAQLQHNLNTKAVKGSVKTLVAQAFKFSLTLGANVVLARLLTPADYGLIGMVTAIVGFVMLFKDLGLSMATIQKEEINHNQVSTLFWINVFFGIFITLVTIAISPLLASFYHEPKLVKVTVFLSIGILISSIGVQHAALLKRQMRFTELAINDVFSQIIGTTAAILSALNGLGYWALVIYPVVTALTSSIGFWMVCAWRPSWPNSLTGVKSFLTFGSNMTGFNIVNYIARNLDNLLIGKYWGAQQLGLYAKAYQLLLLPLNQINAPITNVMIPLLSRVVDTPKRYRDIYLRILEKLVLVTMPLMVCMIATSDWLIQVLLGDQWVPASQLFLWLGIVGFVQPISGSIGWLFISQGRTQHLFQWGIIGSSITVLSFVIGISYKAIGVASSYSITSVFILIPLLFWFTGRSGPIRTEDFYITIMPFIFSSLVAITSAFVFKSYLRPTNMLFSLVSVCIVVFIAFFGSVIILPRGRKALYDFIKISALLKPANSA